MPRRTTSNTANDEPYFSSDENDGSDREDYIVRFAGITKGSNRADFDMPIRTIIFQHAILHGYCSKQPPSREQFLDLVNAVSMPKQGLRFSKKLLKSLASWISNNISSHNLVGLMVENCVGKVANITIYEVHISKALVQAVAMPTFSYTDILNLQDSNSPICQEHARLWRAMLPFGQPGPHLSIDKVVRVAMSYLTETGQIVPSKQANGINSLPSSAGSHALNAQHPHLIGAAPLSYSYGPATPIGAAPGPNSNHTTHGSYTAHAPLTHSAQGPGLIPPHATPSGPPPHGPSSSAAFPTYPASNLNPPHPQLPSCAPACPLYHADKVRANQNLEAYKEWYRYVATEKLQAQATGQPWSRRLKDDWVFNGSQVEYCDEFDYVGWLIAHIKATRQGP